MKQPFSTALFLAGLAIVGWIGVGYVGTHALGVVVTLVIGTCYVAGAVELQRYRQATASLAHALDDTAPINAESDFDSSRGKFVSILNRVYPGEIE